jgi:alpha/beta superfamily hydrolase
MKRFEADLKGVTFLSNNHRLLGGFYTATGDTPRPTAILLQGLPGIEKHLDIAYSLRDLGWNCLYFHFRGCWGSRGDYSLNGLADDTKAAIDWVEMQECVDKDKIVLIAGSTGSHPALVQGAIDSRIKAIIGVSPVIEPSAFMFPQQMADNFAKMLSGITGEQMVQQWNELPSLKNFIQKFSPRPILLIAAGNDDIFPLSDYSEMFIEFSYVDTIERKETDHGFSNCRTWLVQTVTNWLLAKVDYF